MLIFKLKGVTIHQVWRLSLKYFVNENVFYTSDLSLTLKKPNA